MSANRRSSYKETIRKDGRRADVKIRPSERRQRSVRHVKIKIEPNEPGKGYEFIDKIVGGDHSKRIYPCRRRRYTAAPCNRGVLAGYNVVDVKVMLYDG
jgi:elongation factor G